MFFVVLGVYRSDRVTTASRYGVWCVQSVRDRDWRRANCVVSATYRRSVACVKNSQSKANPLCLSQLPTSRIKAKVIFVFEFDDQVSISGADRNFPLCHASRTTKGCLFPRWWGCLCETVRSSPSSIDANNGWSHTSKPSRNHIVVFNSLNSNGNYV